MKKIVALVAISLLAVVTSCHTKNVGGPPVFLSATITVPANMFGNQDATWTANITGGVAPYTVTWDFGGGATPNTATFNNQTTTSSATVNMVNNTAAPANYFAKVTVVDSLGIPFTTPAPGQAYTVGIIQNQNPVVNSATFNAATKQITVSVSDPDDAETLTVNITPPAGITADSNSKVAAATGPLTAVFTLSANDLFAGATGNVAVSVTDSKNATATFAGGVDVTLPSITLADDFLYAIPTQGTAAVGDHIVVVVATGKPANPFQYMNGVGLTMPEDGKYIGGDVAHGGTGNTDGPSTFNIGVPGGAAGDVDGYWTAMAPSGGFLLAPDNFIQSVDSATTGLPGLQRFDFNVTPLGGSNQTTASGALFNAAFKFGSAGTKTFGFQQLQAVKRTYYSDDTTEYFWGNIANDGAAGVPNSVTVN